MFSRPFTIGDWVEIGDEEGIVTEITIFDTRLENFDGETIVLPNDSVSNEPIVNRSERGHYRIRLDVGVDYETDPDHAIEVAQEAIADQKPVADAPPPRIIPKSFGDSAVVLEMRFWIDRPTPPRKWRAIDAVVRAVKEAFEAEDIKIPFPQRELSGRAETGGFRVHDESLAGRDRVDRSADAGE
jgi:small-conductance mechanosensitive channel